VASLLIDIDGVLYVGERRIAGADTALRRLQDEAVPHLLVTNTTSRPRAAVAAKLAAMGIVIDEDRILTPPVAAAAWLRTHSPGRAALFVPEATRHDFIACGVVVVLPDDAESGASAVVLGDLGPGWDFGTYNRAFRLLLGDPRPALVALGMTRFWRAADGLRLDVGPFVKGLEYATGATAVVLGKPAAAFFEMALAELGVAASETYMIGDDVVGDIGGAQAAGIRGVLVKTGKFRDGDLERDDIRPYAVLDSIAEVPAWLAADRS
jgi:phospholysine phosphohistidine inorganic pyrophosphate phosphatase